MKYNNIIEAVFLERKNRFIAKVCVDDRIEEVHVKNTGRCRELLVRGNTVFLEKSDKPERKTKYDLISVYRADGQLINMDSMAPNRMAYEWLNTGILGSIKNLRPEVRCGNSRFDFFGEQESGKVFVEVKGCTLERNGVALFPDAPTERGLKHVHELTELVNAGYRCIVLIVIQMQEVTTFMPNWETHPEFAHALGEAKDNGVEVYAVNCVVRPGEVCIDSFVPVCLDINSTNS